MTPQIGSGRLHAPDVFAALRQEAKSLWSSPVYVAEPPNPRPDGVFAVFTPSGGAEGSPAHGQRAFIADVWGSTAQDAYNAAEMLRGALRSIVNQEILVSNGQSVLVYGVDPVGGVVWMPDPDDKIPRFRMNFTATYRNTQIDQL